MARSVVERPVGRRLDVWEVVLVAASTTEASTRPRGALELDSRLVHTALADSREQQPEIEAFIARVDAFNAQEEVRWRALHGAA